MHKHAKLYVFHNPDLVNYTITWIYFWLKTSCVLSFPCLCFPQIMNIYKMRWNKKYFLLGKLKENSKARQDRPFLLKK